MNILNELISKFKVIPVITINHIDEVLPLGEVLISNGLPCAEITFRTSCAAEAISLMKKRYPDILVGAGTIINAEQVSQAKDSGADFLVSPGLNPKTIEASLAKGIHIIPGINSPGFVEQAMSLGITTVKFYPAEVSGGISMLNALSAVYPVKFMPTGGINTQNLKKYLNTKNVLACGGTWITPNDLMQTGNWGKIAELVTEAVQIANS